MIHLQQQKRHGILPNQIKLSEFQYSMNMIESVTKKQETLEAETSIYDMLIISHNSEYYQIWKMICNILSLVSSYIYLYMAAYIQTVSGLYDPEQKQYEFFFYFNWTMEVIFFIKIGTEFLTDYQEKDLKIIRDFEKIVIRYLKGQFIFDLITVIPFDYFIQIDGGYSRLFYLLKILRLI